MNTPAQRLEDIRKQSAEMFRIAELPKYDPVTSEPNPWVVISKADEDVKFLLEQLDVANKEIARLEDYFDADEDAADELVLTDHA